MKNSGVKMKYYETKVYLEEYTMIYYITKACKALALIFIGIAIGLIWGANAYAGIEHAREERYMSVAIYETCL